MKVFVSGAAGFLGSAVTAELAKRGHEVIGLVRNQDEGRIVKGAGGHPTVGDLLGAGGEWCDLVKKSDKVISLTQPIPLGEKAGLDQMDRYNRKHTEAVTNLIKAASDGNAKAVIVTYDTLCFGDRMGKWVNDFDFVNPIGFCRPLAGSFESIEKAGEDADIPLIHIYPSRVYGNGGWFKLLIDSFRNGTAKVVEPGENYLTLIHVEDAAVFYALAAEKLNKTDNLCLADDRPVQQRVLMDHIADLMDMPNPPMVDFNTYAGQFGILMAETMSSSTRVQGIRAMDLLGHIPNLRSYEAGIRHTLKSMGIEPRRKEMEEAA